VRKRDVRKTPEQAVDTGAFPVPPLPTASKEPVAKERADA
jgi:NADH-quinone oxidoreductase subunit H